MTFQDIRVERDAAVVTLVIDRPESRNAYRSQTCIELAAALDEVMTDDSARVLVLTGVPGSFCSGGDLASQAEAAAAHARQFGHGTVMREGMHRVIRALYDCDKPTIAQIDGPAVDLGR